MNDRDSNDDDDNDDNEDDVLCGGNDENVDASSTRINISSHIVIPGGWHKGFIHTLHLPWNILVQSQGGPQTQCYTACRSFHGFTAAWGPTRGCRYPDDSGGGRGNSGGGGGGGGCGGGGVDDRSGCGSGC